MFQIKSQRVLGLASVIFFFLGLDQTFASMYMDISCHIALCACTHSTHFLGE